MYDPRKVCKIKLENEIYHLFSTRTINCKYTSGDNSRIFQNIDYSTIWMSVWYGLFHKLEFKYEKPKLCTSNLHSNGQVLVTHL